jgi:hypothetical protein
MMKNNFGRLALSALSMAIAFGISACEQDNKSSASTTQDAPKVSTKSSDSPKVASNLNTAAPVAIGENPTLSSDVPQQKDSALRTNTTNTIAETYRRLPADNKIAYNEVGTTTSDVPVAIISPIQQEPVAQKPQEVFARPTLIADAQTKPLHVAENKVTANNPIATLRNLSGKVEVTTSTGTLGGNNGLSLFSGNKVTVLDKSAATLVYADGCKKTLDANTMAVIKDVAECKLGLLVVMSTPKAIGETTTASTNSMGTAGLLGIAAVGLGAAAAAGGGGGGQNPPISPN